MTRLGFWLWVFGGLILLNGIVKFIRLNWLVVPVICLILPAFILGFFMKMGSWGYIIGLCVGAGLGFMAFPAYVPLWLVFVCIIGAIGMLWRTSHS